MADQANLTRGGPAPASNLVLISVFVQAHLATLPKKRAERFICAAKEVLDRYADLAEMPRIRPGRQDEELATAIAEASVWFRAMLPTFRAAVSRE
ncbi:MAG: hypothetical protein ACHP7N_00050 [Caulobacterales bacterium]